MAEHVQAVLDRMVEPLQDLQDREIFSRDEIAHILTRRRQSEYDLRRRNPRKEDYLRYIQAEVNLEQLRQLRTKRQLRVQQQDKRKKRSSNEQAKRPGDKHILHHLHVLWTRTLQKYRSDVSLYLQYADFCKQHNSSQKLSKVLAQAVQLHPRQAGLWIEAASHEFFQGGSVQNARILLQRGLRINPTSQELWHQSFVLELHFVQKLTGRRAVLFGDNDLPVGDKERYKLAQIVFDNAVKSIPDDVDFRLRFLDQCALFPRTHALQQHILASIEHDCASKPEAWITRAMYEASKASKEESTNLIAANDDEETEPDAKRQRKSEDGPVVVLDILRQAINTIPTEVMYSQALTFLEAYLQSLSEQHVSSCRTLLDTIFERAQQLETFSYSIALQRADYISMTQSQDDARLYLQTVVEEHADAPASVTAKLSSLLDTPSESVGILQQALCMLSPARDGYLHLLLELVGASLAADVDVATVKELVHKILFLAPNTIKNDVVEDTYFGISSVYEACASLLAHVEDKDANVCLRLAREVLFHSTLFEILGDFNLKTFERVFNMTLYLETQSSEEKGRRERIFRLFDLAIGKLKDTELVDDYRERLVHFQLNRSVAEARPTPFPTVNGASPQDVVKQFHSTRVVLVRNPTKQGTKKELMWKDLGAIYEKLSKQDRDSWCLETGSADVEPADFLQPRQTSHRAYCSFVVQNDKKAYQSMVDKLPVADVSGGAWNYQAALWIFFGRNARGDMPGRPEHTDSVSHSGTWHYQLSGCKTWLLRPSSKLLQLWQTMPRRQRLPYTAATRLSVTCEPGDILVVDTKLWFHQTVIPAQREPSISYARDVTEAGVTSIEAHMSNVDGMYATNDIEEGSIIFADDQMPHGELHRSAVNANCEVVELEDGRQAVVSTRAIASGEFLCVPESESESVDEG